MKSILRVFVVAFCFLLCVTIGYAQKITGEGVARTFTTTLKNGINEECEVQFSLMLSDIEAIRADTTIKGDTDEKKLHSYVERAVRATIPNLKQPLSFRFIPTMPGRIYVSGSGKKQKAYVYLDFEAKNGLGNQMYGHFIYDGKISAIY